MERERERKWFWEKRGWGVCVCVAKFHRFGNWLPQVDRYPFSPLGPYIIMFLGWALTPIVKLLRLISVAARIGTLTSTPCVKWA
jgi:hypothetical protein